MKVSFRRNLTAEETQVERALKGRSGGRWPGNLRILDVFHDYSSKNYARKLQKMRNELYVISSEIGGLHRGNRLADSRERLEDFKMKASEFVREVRNMQALSEQVDAKIADVKETLAEGKKEAMHQDKRAILAWLGRGSVTAKVKTLKENVKSYSDIADALDAFMSGNYLGKMSKHHADLIEARKAYLEKHGLLEGALEGKTPEEKKGE